MTEPIRLVIWDLDETFWHGTLTEGGMRWRAEAEHAVKTLAARGIVSALCSKNDPADVKRVLAAHRMRRFFVFNSISWESKGPRLAAQIAAIQLRPQSVLFIDDNALNRAEAAHFVPGLQIADETIVPVLLDDARCAGKPDRDLARLAQYKLLERRQKDAARTGGDTTAFLRASNITVRIEHDIDAHIDQPHQPAQFHQVAAARGRGCRACAIARVAGRAHHPGRPAACAGQIRRLWTLRHLYSAQPS